MRPGRPLRDRPLVAEEPVRGGEPVWSGDEAERIARDHLRALGISAERLEFRARRSTEITRLPNPCGTDIRGCWVVYVYDGTTELALRASTIVLVAKRDGAVRYFGDANDDG